MNVPGNLGNSTASMKNLPLTKSKSHFRLFHGIVHTESSLINRPFSEMKSEEFNRSTKKYTDNLKKFLLHLDLDGQ